MLCSLLWNKKDKKICKKKEEDVTILIPMYNSKKTIKETIESIKKQKYCGNIYVDIIDDGSIDGSSELIKSLNLGSEVTLLELEHKGKAYALNE